MNEFTRCNKALRIDNNIYRCKHAEGHTGPHELPEQYAGTVWESDDQDDDAPTEDDA